MNLYLVNVWLDGITKTLQRLSNEDNFVRSCSSSANHKETVVGKVFVKGRAVNERIDVIQLDIVLPSGKVCRINVLCEDIPEHIVEFHTYNYLRKQFDKIIELEVDNYYRDCRSNSNFNICGGDVNNVA
jgi:hypothetical protein